MLILKRTWGFPWWHSGWEFACQCRGHGFDPWPRKIPHVAEQLSPPVTATEPALWNPWATTPEPMCCSCWSPHTWSLCAPQWEKPPSEKTAHCSRVAPAHATRDRPHKATQIQCSQKRGMKSTIIQVKKAHGILHICASIKVGYGIKMRWSVRYLFHSKDSHLWS